NRRGRGGRNAVFADAPTCIRAVDAAQDAPISRNRTSLCSRDGMRYAKELKKDAPKRGGSNKWKLKKGEMRN
ncbi:MAG: hypothetical protein ACJ8LN_11805, partial [Sulfurifustis sp.]